MTNAMLINLVTVKRGPMTSRLHTRFAKVNAELISSLKRAGKL